MADEVTKETPLLKYFAERMSFPMHTLQPAFDGVHKYGPMLGLVLHREGQFQTELFIVPKEVELLEFHNHPNVDSYEMHLAGDFTFQSHGVDYINPNAVETLGDKTFVDVPSEHVHGVLFRGPGAFISFQYWKNGVKPSSVGEDFEVDHKNENHLKNLKGLDRKDKPVILD